MKLSASEVRGKTISVDVVRVKVTHQYSIFILPHRRCDQELSPDTSVAVQINQNTRRIVYYVLWTPITSIE